MNDQNLKKCLTFFFFLEKKFIFKKSVNFFMKSAGFFYNLQKENMLTIEKEDGRKAP